MSAADDKIRVVRSFYAAINDHDTTAIAALLDDDCVRHYPRGSASPIAGDHVGKAAVVATYEHMIAYTAGDHALDVGNVLANDSIAASYHHESATRASDHGRLEAEMLVRWRIEDGRVVELWDYANDVPGLNAFLD
ncbi:MAG TPA: nuclear transport factor 2 family protein [Ilumatobacteraceae bacterium]